jgi:hypothetical protein
MIYLSITEEEEEEDRWAGWLCYRKKKERKFRSYYCHCCI